MHSYCRVGADSRYIHAHMHSYCRVGLIHSVHSYCRVGLILGIYMPTACTVTPTACTVTAGWG